ncbi:uncharacterized protein BP01DRAFT_211459 [Aspergillus saccharolyticus JOP 1030-1]|uniref:Mitochondrial carrier n=1 Tax=Aspergillus saccharolyticus JOP 1030-1 TaxID=1450539 RepID=A0A318Z247_9EURO|nr:hypothetical protein BP01DRAFT_211459 [Aspergillus saccharolyticus JOP 1030-1]PYH40464.1 hypothetical protein BP01DRAFT_211459 [Aspergillus saccharolyticus JOP 1030-1]
MGGHGLRHHRRHLSECDCVSTGQVSINALFSRPRIHRVLITPETIFKYLLASIKTKLQVQVQHRQRTTRSEEKGEPNGPPLSPPSYDSFISAVTHIIQKEGLPGLYRGLSSSILNTAFMNFAYFYWSTHARTAYQRFFRGFHNPGETNIVTELLLRAIGSAMAQR